MSFKLPSPSKGFDVFNKASTVMQDIKRIAGIFNLTPTLEPQRAYMFEVNIIGSGSEPAIKFFIKTATIPESSREPILIDYLDTKIVFPGKYTGSRSMTFTLWDDQRLLMLRYFNRWLDATEEKSIKSNYSRDIKISLKDTSDFIETAAITLKNAFVTNISDIALSYESSDVMELSVTFSYEDKIINDEPVFKFDPTQLLT